jgi:hypothetical protein
MREGDDGELSSFPRHAGIQCRKRWGWFQKHWGWFQKHWGWFQKHWGCFKSTGAGV